jgi:hypothetical protein
MDAGRIGRRDDSVEWTASWTSVAQYPSRVYNNYLKAVAQSL